MNKKIFLFIVFTAVGFLQSVSAQTGSYYEFSTTSTAGTSGTFKLYYSTPGTRIEVNFAVPNMPGGFTKTSIVKKAEPGKVYQLDTKNKTYTLTDVSNQATDKADHTATATVLGTETVSGYSCKHVKVVDGGTNWEMWTTTAITEYSQYSKVFGNQKYIGNHAVHEALQKVGAEGFPVKVIQTEGSNTYTTTLTKHENKTLDNSLFEIPSDYTQSNGTSAGAPAGMGSMKAADIQKMTPEERQKWIEEMKKKNGGGGQ